MVHEYFLEILWINIINNNIINNDNYYKWIHYGG